MRELALHIMDIVENGLAAGASIIHLAISEESNVNRLRITIRDNGSGIPAENLARAADPFFTTRTTRRVGLGLSLFRESARRCEGDLTIASREGHGTEVQATFRCDHIDVPPLGDMAGTLSSLLMGNADVDFCYIHELDGRSFEFDTREVKKELEGLSLTTPAVLQHIIGMIRQGLAELYKQDC
ncbi:MAG: ATP-binding protein [Deltaproteobacteria bacterium]|nr:ATP-binding protein [Deltaproteobacteria bacterium]